MMYCILSIPTIEIVGIVAESMIIVMLSIAIVVTMRKNKRAKVVVPESETEPTTTESETEPTTTESEIEPITEELSASCSAEFSFEHKPYKSFEKRLSESSDIHKAIYEELKTFLLCYKGVKSRISIKCESFRWHGKLLAKLMFTGTTLRICLSLDPEKYPYETYYYRDKHAVKAYKDVPMQIKVSGPNMLRRAKKLIDIMMKERGIGNETTN